MSSSEVPLSYRNVYAISGGGVSGDIQLLQFGVAAVGHANINSVIVSIQGLPWLPSDSDTSKRLVSIDTAGQIRDIRVAILSYNSASCRCNLLKGLTLLFSFLFYRQVSTNANIGQRTNYDGRSCKYCVLSVTLLLSLYNFPF